jgi:hypothetical protein
MVATKKGYMAHHVFSEKKIFHRTRFAQRNLKLEFRTKNFKD